LVIASASSAPPMASTAGLDMSVEAKAAEILALRKQVADANQKQVAQAELLDVSLDAPEPEPERVATSPTAPAATSAAAAAAAAPAVALEPELSTPRVSQLEITATFITDGALGLHFKEDSDPACLLRQPMEMSSKS
jgi:hypothetical protein